MTAERVDSRGAFPGETYLHPLRGSVFLVILAYRFLSVNQPLGRDQGIFACVGQNMLKGWVPYRDLWDQKPPGIHFSYAFFIWLFGDSMKVVQAMDLAVYALTAFMVYSVVREMSGVRTGTLAMLVYFFYSDPLFYGYSNGYWARSQAETYMVPFLIGGLWIFMRFLRSRKARLAYLAGMFWGAAFLFKYTAVFYPVSALVFMWLTAFPQGRRLSRPNLCRFGRTLIILLCGFGTSLVPFVIYFAARGALGDLIEATVFYNLKYVVAATKSNGGPGTMLAQLVKWIQRNPFLWLTGIAGGIAVAARVRGNRRGVILLFYLAAAWAAIAANRRYFHYYFIQIAPPLAMLSAYVLDLGIKAMREKRLQLLAFPALAACVLLLALDVQRVRRNLEPDLDFALGKTSQAEYWAGFVTGDFSFLADMYLARYLEERTDPEDPVFIFGFEPLVYFLADRRPASRYIYNDPITSPGLSPEAANAKIEMMVADLERSRPAYIVVVERDANPVDPTDSYRFFRKTPVLRRFVEEGYVLDRQARRFHIYRRRETGC